jgi:plastocyanin
MWLRRVLQAAAVLFFLTPSTLPSNAQEAMVKIDNFVFAPERLEIKAGTKVTFYNEDDIPHSIVAADKAFRSKALDTDESFSFTFTSAGSYEYFCGLHPHMKGLIVVTQ